MCLAERADIEAFQSKVCVIVVDFRRLCVLVAVLAAASLRDWRMKLEGECVTCRWRTLFSSVIYFLQFWLVPAEAI